MLGNVTRKFAASERGSVSIVFALSLVPMLMLAGGVIDYSRTIYERQRLQNALDAAVLAAMREKTLTTSKVKQIIRGHIKQVVGNDRSLKIDLNDLKVRLKDGRGKKMLDVVLTGEVKTSFLAFTGYEAFPLAVRAQAKDSVAGLEVVMVLDNTGSMRGSKIRELRKAASELVDTLHEVAQRAETVKVGLVPYTSYVNVGTDKRKAWWLDTSCCLTPPQNRTWYWNIRYSSFNRVRGISLSRWRGVVGWRESGYDIRDDNYGKVKVPAIDSKYYYWGRWYSTTPPLSIEPLTEVYEKANAQRLKQKINRMWAGGWTYIPAGLVWGWRVLSSQAPYTEGADASTARKKAIRKVIVLMTDGANTCRMYKKGYMQCGVRSGPADDRMRKLCDRIKDEGIGIISVAYNVRNKRIKQLMSECANLGYYEPRAGELRETFRNIADKITRLYLSR